MAFKQEEKPIIKKLGIEFEKTKDGKTKVIWPEDSIKGKKDRTYDLSNKEDTEQFCERFISSLKIKSDSYLILNAFLNYYPKGENTENEMSSFRSAKQEFAYSLLILPENKAVGFLNDFANRILNEKFVEKNIIKEKKWPIEETYNYIVRDNISGLDYVRLMGEAGRKQGINEFYSERIRSIQEKYSQ